MAEGSRACELEGLEEQLESLSRRYAGGEPRADGKGFCSDFRKLVEKYASRWQVPLPQLRILEMAVCYFARASTFFTPNCDHVLHTLSSLALSVFELLLFFDQKDLQQEPLKHFIVTFQECYLALARYQNVHLLQVERLVQGSGPWACPALQAILSGSSLPQSEVDGCISSELPVFFELRVRYLLSCERVSEAMALAKCCAWHPTAGQHLFFLQVYLTWLLKTSQHDSLHKEVADFNGKDAIHIICSLECEEKDEVLLALSRAFLSQQLCRGDMYYLCDLVFVWSKLHRRLKTSRQALLEEIHQLMKSATNVNSIFPFIRAILQEVGEDGIQFCVELCANALQSCLPCDVITKSLIYKTIASLLPNDLEVCRACALLVFFLERTVEAYKTVYLLYMHPDQEYHVEHSPIRNHVRFETLQILKKDLYFDPEFWNLIALRTNCLKLMSERVVSSALEEIMEDKWILNYSTKESAARSSQKGSKGELQAAARKRHPKEDTEAASKRLKLGPSKARLNDDHTVKRKGSKGSRSLKDSSEPLRRSFWQLDKLQDNGGYGEHRRITRLSEKNPPKRRIRTPKWLLEDSGTLGENNVPPKLKKHGLKNQKHHQSSVDKRSDTGQIKNNAKHKPSGNSHLMARENNSNQQRALSLELQPSTPPQVILELSLPDNELMGTFNEDTCNRHRGFPQVLFYKPTVKLPAASQPVKTVHRKEVVIRARDAAMFVQQLHCYARRQKGKGNGSNIQGSVSTITRSSVHGSPPKGPQRELFEKPAEEMKGGFASLTPAGAAEVSGSPDLDKNIQAKTTKAGTRKVSSELSERSAVEMKGTVASHSPQAANMTDVLGKVPPTSNTGNVSHTKTRELTGRSTAEMKGFNASQSLAATEAPTLDNVLQAQTRGHCEESAVEMKVTIASQTTTAGKVTHSPGLDKGCKTQAVKDYLKTTTSADVLQTSDIDSNRMIVTEEIQRVSNTANLSNSGTADPTSSLSPQAETGSPELLATVSSSISEVDLLHSQGHVCENDASFGGTMVPTYTPTDPESMNDLSALTLVTEMVTELAPETQVHKQLAPEDSKESNAQNKHKGPRKLHTPSSCSVSELGASSIIDIQGKEEESDDFDPDTPENSEPVESEESKLEYCCTFCNKVFKGSRVVAHAMFHYRKDECMFCGTAFKDDLLAMMHLSDHIEKLKRNKDPPGKSQENCLSETKDISTTKTSAKSKTTSMSFGRHSSASSRKSAISPESVRCQDSTPSGSRKLRSNDKPSGPSSQKNKPNSSKHLNSKTPFHKLNGLFGKKKEFGGTKTNTANSEAKEPRTQLEFPKKRASNGDENPRLQENLDVEMDSVASFKVDKDLSCSTDNKMKETESLQVLKTSTKQDGQVVEEKNAEPQEKVCCPVDGCTWYTDLSKNRVALLYHALEDHYGEVTPLELAFRIGNSRCSICMRVLWSFEHFQHHVERHRLTPRHPCLHKGCAARFKTGMEMRRHARRHDPLQAVCCLPGCSQLFICLWALNLHEKEHYSSKPTKPDKNTSAQTDDKHNMPVEKKQQDFNPKDEAVNKTVSLKASRKSRGQAAQNSSTGEHPEVLATTTVRASLQKQELKGSNDTHVLKNLSNKDTSTEPTGPNLRLRQTIKKMKVTNMHRSHKVISSSLLKHNSKERHKFKKKQVKLNTKGPKRRGRPTKSKKTHDENITTRQNNESVKVETNQRPPTELTSPSLQDQDVIKTAETSITVFKSKKSLNKQIKKNHVKQKGLSNNTPTFTMIVDGLNQSVNTTSADRTTTVKMKKPCKVKKRIAPKESGSQTASSDSSKSKKQKVTNGKANTEIKEKCPLKEAEPAKSNFVFPQVEAVAATVKHCADGEKAENKDSMQNCSGNSVSVKTLNETTAAPTASGEKPQKVATKEKSKKSDISKQEGKKEKKTHTASDSGKTNKKHKHTIKKEEKKIAKERRPCKDGRKISLKKASTSKSVDQQQVEAKSAAAVECFSSVKAGDETSNATSDCGPNQITSPPTATGESAQKATGKEKSEKKKSDPSKTKKKRKPVPKDGDAKTVKRECKDPSSVSETPAKSEPEFQQHTDVKAEGEESSADKERKTSVETPLSTSKCSGFSKIMNGQVAAEDEKSTVCKDTLAKYGKKPYMRPPPTAYLDEKYTTMPKRRKEMLLFQSSQSPVQEKIPVALQRQRCANCFATFNSAEDLQSHVQLQKCSNLFGFDSDDEGNS